MSDTNQVFNYDALQSLSTAVRDEMKDLLDRIGDNGAVTLKPGSPAIATILGLNELYAGSQQILAHKMNMVKQAYEA